MAYLEAVSGLDGARAYKRRSFETLRIRPGARILDVGCGTGEDLRELAVSDALLDLSAAAERAEDEGVCPPGAAAAWVAQLRQAVSEERFLTALTLFVVCGQKP